ncbi:MAG: hypothetical protein M1812_006898 [Candelaria pacifica]|nr:MAG: hypothetical protein M1812_006898 [Candelaria pacifica]
MNTPTSTSVNRETTDDVPTKDPTTQGMARRRVAWKYTAAQIRFICILRHLKTNRNCWQSITASFNKEFETRKTVRAIEELYAREQTKPDLFSQYLQQHGSVPSQYRDEYEDILRRFGSPTYQRQNNGRRRSPYSPIQMRFVVILEHLTKGQYSSQKDRWSDIAILFNEYFNKQATYINLSDLWKRAIAWKEPIYHVLHETGMVPDEFQKEYQDFLQAYKIAKEACFAVPTMTDEAQSECSTANSYQSWPTSVTDDERPFSILQSGCSVVDHDAAGRISDGTLLPTLHSESSAVDHDDASPTNDERLFLILLEHFSFKDWDELTESLNREFDKSYEQPVLFQQWERDQQNHLLCAFLNEQGRVPQELAEYLDCILSKHGVGDILGTFESLTCKEFNTCQHSGPINPCEGSHKVGYSICESCKESAFSMATEFTPAANEQSNFICDDSMGLPKLNVCVRPASDKWLCLECQLSHRLGV